jgi:FixJ family two-component response regulator
LCTAKSVSIVDDDEAIRLATASLVCSLGWQARVFASAEEFLQSEHVAETSCLICDVRLPRMSGIVMHDRLLELGHAPPTILITALPTAALQEKALASGALALLAKPVDTAAMMRWLDGILGQP